jgi:glycosyltransferase involved in cell wall biosynthesis
VNKSVDIIMMTYNHEKYIEKAIQGVLIQETDFPIRLFIANDASSDRTKEICDAYAQKYPDKIVHICNKENMGGQKNFESTFKRCSSKYIAMCEGDDYWTDPLKLQKQIDFLEANPDYAITHHRLRKIYEDGKQGETLSPQVKETTTFEDLALEHHIGTLAVVYRNHLFNEFPEWFEKMSFGDYVLFLLVAEHGKIKYFDEPMAVYRIHNQGISSGANVSEKMITWIITLKQCREYFHPRAYSEFTESLAWNYPGLCFHLFKDGEYVLYRKYFLESLKYARKYSLKLVVSLTARYFLSYAPFTNSLYEKVKEKITGKNKVSDVTYNEN